MRPLTRIAIDGPVAAGKGTLGRALAHHFNFAYLDTGALYRALALLAYNANITKPIQPEAVATLVTRIDPDLLASPALRTENIGMIASKIAKMPAVRLALLDYQRRFGQCESEHSPPPKGVILDGRDIGTVVLPDAEVKFFITASEKTRAQRRLKELHDKGLNISFETVLNDLKTRDNNDMNRVEAPLRIAKDAFIIDNSELNHQQALDMAIRRINEKIDDID